MADERSQRILHLYPLVYRLAHRVRRMVPGAEYDELVGDGGLGLIRAVDTYDARRGVPLLAYATRVVTGAMLNGLRKRDPVSERSRRRLREAERVAAALAHTLGRHPTSHEVERACPGFLRAERAAFEYTPLSLDAPLPDRLSPRSGQSDPLESVVTDLGRRELRDAVATLPARQRYVITLHYGQALPLRHLGTHLAVSAQRVSQLHLAALRHLRRAIVP